MKFKCGKCGQIVDGSLVTPTALPDGQHILVKCTFCNTPNKLLKEQPVAPLNISIVKNDEPTQVISAGPQKPIVEKKIIPGWLFVHDENTQMQSFDLKIGKNIIGRKSSVDVDVPIETNDMYMSRRHCIIEVIQNRDGSFAFQLTDYKAVNGTFINGLTQKRLRTEDVIVLNDGDTIQLGMTKIVLRKYDHLNTRDEIQSEVKDKPYAPTVLVSRSK